MENVAGPSRDRPIVVTYEASPSRDVWNRIQNDLMRRFPFRHIHWNSTTRPVRTIESLDVEFKALPIALADAAASAPKGQPMMNVIFVACDDVEAYKVAVRTEVGRWIHGLEARGVSEWLIVHITGVKSPSQSTMFGKKGGILARIKADFNPPKRERCMQIPHGAASGGDLVDAALWSDFCNRLKEGIFATLETRVAEAEENIRSMDAKRMMEGWNFCNFFATKEQMADIFEEMHLFEDALVQYDELDAAFYQILRDNSDIWAARRGASDRTDDSASILAFTRKAYREQIRANSITNFDFRIYIFARQTALLTRLRKFTEIATRATAFISLLGQFLREHRASLTGNFIQSWTFSACVTVVAHCQALAANEGFEEAETTPLLRPCAEMLDLARKQLDVLGVQKGYLPREHPFSMSLEGVEDESATANGEGTERPMQITRQDLLVSLDSQDSFDKFYLDVTNRAIAAFQKCGRKRSALKLHASVAALEKLRGRESSAQRLYAHLPAHYVDGRWTSLEGALLDKCAELQSKLNMPREWLLSTLALVRSGIEFGAKEWHQPVAMRSEAERGETEEQTALATRLIADVRRLASKLEKDFAAIAFPTFAVTLAGAEGQPAEDDDGSVVIAKVVNLLPCPVEVDAFRMKFSGTSYDQLWFTNGARSLPPGSTDIKLYCPTPVVGTLALELSQIRITRIIFQYSHRPLSVRNLAPDVKSSPVGDKQPKVHFPKDPNAFDAHLEIPDETHLDRDRTCILVLTTGRNAVTQATVNLGAGDRLVFDHNHAVSETEGLKLQSNEKAAVVVDIQARTTVRLAVPYRGTPNEPTIPVHVNVDYFTARKPETKRAVRKVCMFPIALPVAVSVQDFFRPDCILSRFSVTTDGRQPLRIKSARLAAPSSVTVLSARKSDAEPITLSTAQVSNFLFRLETPSREQTLRDDVMRLDLSYRTVLEEITFIVQTRVRTALTDTPFSHLCPTVAEIVLAQAVGSSELDQYAHKVRIRLPSIEASSWEGHFRELVPNNEQRLKLTELVMTATSEPLEKSASDAAPWRSLTIPVDLPSISILNVVSATFPAGATTTSGRPLALRFTIKSSFRWATPEVYEALTKTPVDMLFDVHAHHLDWVLSGIDRGSFTATDEGEHIVDLTVTPLREGSLLLPTVVVQTKVTPGPTCETHLADAAVRVTVLPAPAPPSPSGYYVSALPTPTGQQTLVAL